MNKDRRGREWQLWLHSKPDEVMTPTAQATPEHPGELCTPALGGGPKTFAAPKCEPPRAAAVQESPDISLEKHVQMFRGVGWGGGGGKGKKEEQRQKGETLPAVCWGGMADSFISENCPVRDLYIGICRQVTP